MGEDEEMRMPDWIIIIVLNKRPGGTFLHYRSHGTVICPQVLDIFWKRVPPGRSQDRKSLGPG